MGTLKSGRPRRGLVAVPVLLLSVLAACGVGAGGSGLRSGESAAAAAAHHFDVERIAHGLDRPTFVGAAPGDPGALWVLEQSGRVVRVQEGIRSVALDISAEVGLGGERGLLGIAFHPGFAGNGRVFLHWSDRLGDTRVAEFQAAPDRRTIGPVPVRELLHLDQPEENHNGGHLAFGPDGRLYLALGDGGGAFDPRRTAQDPGLLLGKIVAADVDLAAAQWRPVVIGLRNPWRFSFDPALSDLWIGDVGQDDVEEVNRVPLELDEPPKNLGWSAYEGDRQIPGHHLDPAGELVAPVATYPREEGCSIIGGVVYGGAALPDLVRRYVYGDFCSGTLWSLRGTPEGRATDVRRERAKVPQLSHIGVDADGELVLASTAGSLYRAVPPAGWDRADD